MTPQDGRFYGLVAEFDTPDKLIHACEEAKRRGYDRLGAYTPYPIEEVWEVLGHHKSRLPLIVAIGAIIGLAGGLGLQYWASVIEYPMNIGGRPYASWIAFIPAAFETTILVAAFFCVLGMFALNGLPQPYHPIFSVERFSEASSDRYFLMIRAIDPQFDRQKSRVFLEELDAYAVEEVHE